jgi:hypothetical protein
MRILMAILVLFASGCASLRETDPKAADDAIGRIRSADTFKSAADRIDDVRTLYYEQVGVLKNDMIGSGDAVTGLGVGAGIVAASTGVAADVLKGIGILGATIGVWDLRYKPAQQRQSYLDATQALGCMSDRVRQLDGQTAQLARMGVTAAEAADTPAKAAALKNITEATDIAYRDVLAVHRRLQEKLFSAVSTQSVSAIKDNLLKEAIAEHGNAEALKEEPISPAVRLSLMRAGQLEADLAKSGSEKDRAEKSLRLLEKRLVNILADAATYKTDMDACASSFLK